MNRLTSLLILLTVLAACGGSSYVPSSPSPTPPAPAPSSPPIVSGKVLNEPGICIEGATVEVVRGQLSGLKVTQATPSNYWSYGDEEGFVFTGLTPDVDMTLRASASGYAAEEKTVRPSTRGTEVFFTLSSTQ